MTQRFNLERVPDFTPPAGGDATMRQLQDSIRTAQRNFQRIERELLRGILDGGLVPSDLSVPLAGDATGTTAASIVEKIRGNNVPDPAAAEDNKLLRYDDGAASMIWTTIIQLLDLISSTQGALLRRGAAGWEAVALGADNTLLSSDGADPGWETLSSLIDAAIGSTRGTILFRGAAGWEALAVGTLGQMLQTNGAAADPSWEDSAGGVPGTDFDLVTTGSGTATELVFDDGSVVWDTFA